MTAVAGIAFDANRTAHQADQSFRDGKTETSAAVLSRGRHVRLGECFEDTCLLILGNADAGVCDFEFKLQIHRLGIQEANMH
jgi:hypothetical protein